MTVSPPPVPIPLPVTFGPHEADWWMVVLTALGIVTTLLIALLTFRANRRADASRAVAERVQVELLEQQATAFNASQEASRAQIEALKNLVGRGNENAPDMNAEELPEVDVRWLLERDAPRRNGWLVRNIGTATAHAVRIRGLTEQDNEDLLIPYEEPLDAPPYTAIPFSVWRSLASPAATVVEITWSDALGRSRANRVVVT